MACEACEHKEWAKLTLDKIVAHLVGYKEDGSDVLGMYPLLPDGTCRFLVFDFDNHEKGAQETDFANTDNVLAKRMTDFLSGTVYALAGSMKKLSRNILVCAPKNIDIDSDMDTEEGSAFEERRNRPWEK